MNDKARRNLDFRPPLRDTIALGVGSSIAAKSLSSRDIRFSAAVKFPCDSGDGRIVRGVAAAAPVAVVDAAEVAVVGKAGVIAEGRVE